MNNNELYHYGVSGMKWGHHKYVDSSGNLTRKGIKRQNKMQKYRDKLIRKAQRKEDNNRFRADDLKKRNLDLKKNGIHSEDYRQWRENRDNDRRRDYDSFNTGRDYSKSLTRAATTVADYANRKQTIKNLTDSNNVEARHYIDTAKTWVNRQSKLKNTKISAFTTKKELKEMYKGH